MTDWSGHIDVIGFGAFVLAAAGMMLRHILTRADRQVNDYRDLVENHLAHNTEALLKLEVTLNKLLEHLSSTEHLLEDNQWQAQNRTS